MLWHCRHQPRVPPAATGPPRPSGGPAPLPLAAELPRTSPCRGPQRHPCPLLPGLPPAAAAAPLVPCHPAAQDTPYPQHPGTVRASRPAQPRVSVEMASPEPAQPEREGFHGDAVSSTAQPAREIAAAMPEPGPRCLQWGRSPWEQAAATRAAPGEPHAWPPARALPSVPPPSVSSSSAQHGKLVFLLPMYSVGLQYSMLGNGETTFLSSSTAAFSLFMAIFFCCCTAVSREDPGCHLSVPSELPPARRQ